LVSNFDVHATVLAQLRLTVGTERRRNDDRVRQDSSSIIPSYFGTRMTL